MEVLNQNQRNGAIKRLLLLSLACLLMLVFMMFTLNIAYENVGDSEMLLVEKEYAERNIDFDNYQNDMKFQIDSLGNVLHECEKSQTDNEELEDCLRDKKEAQKQLRLKKKTFKKESAKEARLAIELQDCQNQY